MLRKTVATIVRQFVRDDQQQHGQGPLTEFFPNLADIFFCIQRKHGILMLLNELLHLLFSFLG